MIGQTLSHYRVIEELGSGGMGDVYKAHDERLRRDVAIKVLREDLASDPERLRRFELEARAASALNHPNIVTIYDIGRHGHTPYIAMELVEGDTLRTLVSRGPLPSEKVLPYAIQIAEGLAKAHTAGIVHRDLKPENLMVTNDGYVKILDFGLAKLLPHPRVGSEAATITSEDTATGRVMGTPSYMSPEQALGRPLDARTDVFSFGSVLYEMATGRRPFKDEAHASLLDEILHRTPPPPSSLNSAIPVAVDDLVRTCLQKKPELRYPSARELLAALRALQPDQAPGPARSDKAIVVLPFENMSPDPDQEYFCDGITEEIISDLSLVDALRVISRSTAMTFKGTQKKTREISNDVNVRYVLEGSVRKAGHSIRVTAQLIDALDDSQVWTEKYSGTLEDIFDIQERISRAIVGSLKVVLAPEWDRRLTARRLDDALAYDCYLRARQDIARWTEAGLDRAVQQLEMASRIVGDNPVLLAGLGYAHVVYYYGAFRMNEETLQKAEDYATRAIQLDPDTAQGYLVLGAAQHVRGRMQSAFRHLQNALRLRPDDPDAIYWLEFTAIVVGRLAVTRPLVERLLAIDPLSPNTYMLAALQHTYEGEFEAALGPARTLIRLDPDGPLSRWTYFNACVWARRPGEVEPALERWRRESPHPWYELFAALVAAQQGRDVEISDEGRDLAWKDVLAAGLCMPVLYSLLGRIDEALKWLERAFELGYVNYPLLARIDPFLDNLRRDPGSRDIMRRIRRAWEQVEV